MSLFDVKRLRFSVIFGLRSPSQLLPRSSVESYFFTVNIFDRSFSTSELYERFGEPESEAVIRVNGKPLTNGVPANVYVPGWFGACSDNIALGEERIILSDFGESFDPHETLSHLRLGSLKTHLPLPLTFGHLPVPSGEIFGQGPLFKAFWPTTDRVTAERLEWFNEEGELDSNLDASRGHDSIRRTLDKKFSHCIQEPRAKASLETVTEKERRAFEAILRSMLVFRPKRKSYSTADIALRMDERMGTTSS
ncbi:uncharacterized protein N7477_006291 [Penicillium maclennaniae]|uniref:uncharacterized protein n=1 Tax=Penicillium maclennaniae TaxID=1343394 RepID=UPI00253FE684|nr:uncharacterized protein N7477_006291 [Penicillium maclennaniae]KAJ5667721.1 hypothetical protein N7477_006291 [Penicillium maclennaniae]